MLEQAEAAEAAGADYVVATAPFYARADDGETAAHFQTLSRECPVPVVAYHIPGRTGRPLSPAVLGRLAADGALAGVKDSSADLLGLRAILAAEGIGAGFSVMTGSEMLVDMALFTGASGAVPGLANVDPAGFVRIYDAAQRGDWDTARAEQARLRELFGIVKAGVTHGQGPDAAAYGGLKAALSLRGVLRNAVTAAPQTPVPPAAREEIKLALVKAGLL
jgi:4-hydroxy-tetrahydrodipicolinate synthase